MVLYVRGEKSCLVDELDKLLWTTIRTVVVIHFCSSTQPLGVVTSVQTEDPEGGAAVPVVKLVQWDMDLFTVSLLVLTSLVHMAAVYTVTDTLAASHSVALPHAANHDTSDRFH